MGALEIDSLSKEYRAFASFRERLATAFSLGLLQGSLLVRALDDISLNLGSSGRGEILGVIGPNGAGKSTLLRILAGNSPPSSGRVRFSGSVRSILELGVGFSPALSGADNVYYNGRLWGFSGRELRKNLDEIVGFAQVEDFVDQPLQTYSTGMQMRLGFSLATYRRSDLLLVDEAMAVGDAAFQQKCIKRFEKFRDEGSLILVVSHDVRMLQSVCDRILLLYKGKNQFLGDPTKAVDAYMDLIAADSFVDPARQRTLEKSEYSIDLLDETGAPRRHYFSGQASLLRIRLRPREEIKDATVGIHISDGRGIRAFGVNTKLLARADLSFGPDRESLLEFRLRMNLGPGRYTVGLSVHRGRAHAEDCYLWKEGEIDFEVESPGGSEFEGMSFLEPELRIE